ncbi:hypothetical protein AGMMS49942_16770 [Spirochaetia bacterium]|nr:hypothetical protein AGMMS49942_16770 [Spirochaetia bacterium]
MRNIALVLAAAFMLCSCVGLASEIVLRRDGSLSMSLEYRFSRELESLGKLDGNENWPPLPVGKADFERTVARIEGLSLGSFTTKTAGKDVVNQVKLDFTNLEALVRFLDASGQRASLAREGGKTRLTLSFGGGGGGVDPELLALLASATEGYSLDFGLTLPHAPELRERPQTGAVVLEGNRVGFSMPLAELLSGAEPVTLEILW